ncbi:hypothetical protein Moror_11212 [Moniliophthora roreri MCA 2997]|uniref:Uncharacterized protein n=1 Tax=Moniliophthora roreri (strain MCA 2997) TaxID=1381753 RepID=V2WM60_MONRO|nr:hypothetical protein Moror_11212 [Moniliophthora roreri MCA 2997]
MYFTLICHISHISRLLRPKPRSIVKFSAASNDPSHCHLSFDLLTAIDSLTPVLLRTAPAVVTFLVGLLIGSFFWISAGIGYWVMAKKGAVDAELQENEYEFPAPGKEGGEPVKHRLWTLKLTGAGGLKELCQTYHLPTSLGIDASQSKLIEFSENPEKNKVGKKCPHKALHGPRDGTKAKKAKTSQSQQHHAELMGKVDERSDGYRQTLKTTKALEHLKYADHLPEECPEYYKPRVPQGLDRRDADIERNDSRSSKPAGPTNSYPICECELPTNNANFTMTSITLTIHASISITISLATVTFVTCTSLSITIGFVAIDLVIHTSTSTTVNLVSCCFTGRTNTSLRSCRPRKIMIRSDITLEFMCGDVPCLPAVSFKKIEDLRRVWDDSLASFVAEECPVIIQRHRIAYKYWDQVFSHKGEGHDPSDRRWGKIGKLHNVWKHVADYYLPRTDEEFWAEFTDNKGEHMSFTAISKVLAAHCKAVQAS